MSEKKSSLLELMRQADGLLFLAANAADLASVLRRVRDELGIEPPDDYMDFLRQSDGAISDGLMIYGSRTHLVDDVEMPELVGINLERREYRDDLGDLLLLGEVDDDFAAYRPSDKLYWRIDRVSGDLLGSAPDLHSLIASILHPGASA